jgi:phage tail sheath gpL-like
VVELGIYVGDTYRVVRADQVYNADALRQAIADQVYNADALRQAIADQVYNADALRQAIADQVYNADALRQAIKEYEFIADTLRHVITPYTQLIITLSTQEREVKLGVEQMPLIGNTVRLKAEFKDFNGEHVSPENVILRIYNAYKKQVGEDIPVSPSDVGKYQYDYIIPGVVKTGNSIAGTLYFEFVGTIGGLPVLGRATIDKKWI